MELYPAFLREPPASHWMYDYCLAISISRKLSFGRGSRGSPPDSSATLKLASRLLLTFRVGFPHPSPRDIAMINYSATSAAVAIAFLLYSVLRRRSAVRNILGPPSPSWIFGNMLQLLLAPVYGENEFKWQKLYGPIYRLKGCFGQDRLMVADPLALQYIINTPHFEHSPLLEHGWDLLFGMGSVVVVKGEAHRRLRVALNPGFSASAITTRLESSSATSIDMCPLLCTAALSAVSEAVLGYSIDQLGEEFILADTIAARLPIWLSRTAIYLPTAVFKALRKAKYVAKQLGDQIVREKLQAAKQGLEINTDVYSLLRASPPFILSIAAYLPDDVPATVNPDESEKTGKVLSDEEVAAQTAVILTAGQDTTSNTLAFALLELATQPDFQEKLRAEIHSTFGGGHGNVAYDNMPLLNAFIKVGAQYSTGTYLNIGTQECLRFYPAGAILDCIAVRDMVIPLAESITTATGERVSEIPVQKGQLVTLALASCQRLESRWGKDAHEFKPSRWIEGTPYKGEAVGPYASLLSFLGGSRTCLGWRFAILEMHVIICELVGKFSFALSEKDPVRTRFADTLLPTVRSGEKGAPLCITRVL
ncbi:cytochrome P450 [Mycena epipterygia]|nr:cytochrome P450 [Mycena epipterygia]